MNDVTSAIRVVIADEQPTFRQTLRALLEAEYQFPVLGEASDSHSAARLIHQLRPNVLLIDYAQLRELQTLLGDATALSMLRIIVTLATVDKSRVVEAFRFGAHAIVPKTCASVVLLRGIRAVMTGHYWLESENLGALVEALKESPSHTNGKSPRDFGLTRREADIMTLIASGHSNKEVGEEFSISERTVKHHLTNIFSKLGVSSRLQLALFAVNHQFTNSKPAPLALQTAQTNEEA